MSLKSSHLKLLLFFVLLIILNKRPFAGEDEIFSSVLQKAIGFKYQNPDSLISYAQKACNIAMDNNNPDQKLDALIVLIEANIRSGELLNALQLCDSIEIIKTNSNLIHRETEILISIGNVYAAMGFAAEALDLFFEVLNKVEEDIPIKTRLELYYYISMVYFNVGEMEESRKYLDLSSNLAIKNKYIKDIIPAYILKSSTYTQPDSIILYLNLANDLIRQSPNLKYELVVILNNKALLNKVLGNFILSKSEYIKAIRISKKNGFEEHLANLYNNYAYLLMAESNHDSAKIVLREALVIAKDIKSADLTASVYDSYSDYYNAIGDYKNALAYQDSSIVKREQFRKEQQAQRSLYLAAVFETEQKEKALLEQENRITRLLLMLLGAMAIIIATVALVVWFRQRLMISKIKVDASEKGKKLEVIDALIKGQDSERKRLAMDLHDGLGAKMGSLRFLVDKNYHDTNSYSDVTSALDDIKNNIRDLSHRMLPSQIEDFGLTYCIYGLIKSINKSDKFEVEFDTNITRRLSDKLESNLYYLIFELINNATVHSKGNNITVQLIEHDNRLNLSVEDDGGGFDINRIGSGAGMKNIRTRVEYLQGTYDIDAGENDTVVYIEIPKDD